MATSASTSANGSVNLERELVCFICTEILYQPLTLIDCLHSFCGSCLKEWFSHQHRKASSSHTNSSANPYTCPTCRAPVKDVQKNAMVNTLLEVLLTANPERRRSELEKQELAEIYKPGDNIMPKVEPRRRERRGRREEDAASARERRMVQEARERGLRDLHGSAAPTQDTLQPPAAPRQGTSSRSRDREQRRERRREQDRRTQEQREQATENETSQGANADGDQQRRESVSISAPTTSPRHPEAVEARQRQQTVVHQASLTSLISSSESGAGSNSNDSDTNRIMQEILAEGLPLLDGVDIDALTETEQDALAERIAEAYRQRRRERNERNNPSSDGRTNLPRATTSPQPDTLQIDDGRRHRRTESGSRQRRADTLPAPGRDDAQTERPRTVRTQPPDGSNSLPPPTSVVLTHRRRTSSQGQRSDGSRNRSRQSSPATRSANSGSQSTADVANQSRSQDQAVTTRQTTTNGNQRPALEQRDTPRTSDIEIPPVSIRSDVEPQSSPPPVASSDVMQTTTSPRHQTAELAGSGARTSKPVTQPTSQTTRTNRRASGLFEEPSISCFRCHRADIQYEIHRHCDKCDVTLCHPCYRAGRGCRHHFGFGHAAMSLFDSIRPSMDEQMELPHNLQIGRRYTRPEDFTIIRSKLAKDGTTIIPLQTTSNPAPRLSEGRFCDRCGNFANSCFWSCDVCNFGEWGFCRDCVNTHHCCTHPLLPSAHKSYAPASLTMRSNADNINPTASELLSANLRPSPLPSQPSSAASGTSFAGGPFPDFINLVITTHCDICSQPIQPTDYRFHCPFHPSPSSSNPEARGDYDICTPCYQSLVKTNRIKRDDGSAGWRKCPSGHRMIITTFVADSESGQRRLVVNDLVGGWKTPEEAMIDWNAELELHRDNGNGNSPSNAVPGSPDMNARRMMRTRTGSYGNDSNSPTGSSGFNSSSRFPPDGGCGLRGVAWWTYYPNEGDKGPHDLEVPSGAEIREIRIDDNFPDWCGGVYAGDRGLLPSSFVRFL